MDLTGIVIATRAGANAASPLEVVAGIALALRTALELQKQGAQRVVVFADEGDAEELRAIFSDKRVRVPIEVVVAHAHAHEEEDEDEDDDGRVGGWRLVGFYDVVADSAVYRALRDAERGEANALAASREGERIEGPMLIAPEVRFDCVSRVLDDAAVVREVDVGRAWSIAIRSSEDRRRVVYELFEACRKPVDGIVSRNLNRHISIFVSKLIVNTPITPNQISVLTFFLAIAGAACCARGTYASFLAGAVLLQWNSILDGVDGELARVRYQQSKLGEWVDTVCDDASNALYYSSVGLGAAQTAAYASMSWMGYAAAGLCALTAVFYYSELIRLGSGDFYALAWKPPAKGALGAIALVVKYTTKKDFFIFFFMLMAAFGVLPWALPIMLVGTTMTAVAGLFRTVKWLATRKAR